MSPPILPTTLTTLSLTLGLLGVASGSQAFLSPFYFSTLTGIPISASPPRDAASGTSTDCSVAESAADVGSKDGEAGGAREGRRDEEKVEMWRVQPYLQFIGARNVSSGVTLVLMTVFAGRRGVGISLPGGIITAWLDGYIIFGHARRLEAAAAAAVASSSTGEGDKSTVGEKEKAVDSKVRAMRKDGLGHVIIGVVMGVLGGGMLLI